MHFEAMTIITNSIVHNLVQFFLNRTRGLVWPTFLVLSPITKIDKNELNFDFFIISD